MVYTLTTGNDFIINGQTIKAVSGIMYYYQSWQR